MIGRFRTSGAGALWVLGAILGGCSSSYLVVRSRLLDPGVPPKPEITATIQYAKVRPETRHVVLSPPESCSGSARRDVRSVTECSVVLTELERALADVGYTVTSWRELSALTALPGSAPIAAAQKLGAQVLFQLNTLAQVDVTVGKDAKWERHFGKASEDGLVSEVALSDETISELRGVVAPAEQAYRVRGVLLDVTAVWVPTQQPMWFYRSTSALPRPISPVLSVFARWQDGNRLARAELRTAGSAQTPDPAPSGEENDASYYAFLKGVVSDFAAAYAGRAR